MPMQNVEPILQE